MARLNSLFFIFAVFFYINTVFAFDSSMTISANGRTDTITVIRVDSSSVSVRLYEETVRSLSNIQGAGPYVIEPLDRYGLILKSINSGSAILMIGIQLALEQGETNEIFIDGKSYKVTIENLGSVARIAINDESVELMVQSQPYSFTNIAGLFVAVSEISEEAHLWVFSEKVLEQNFDEGCISSCYKIGESRCHENFYIVCGNYDDDDCLEYGRPLLCGEGEVCSNGVCTNLTESNLGNREKTDSLGSVGERAGIANIAGPCDSIGDENQNFFCSEERVWREKNQGGFECRYDYECLYGCNNGKCNNQKIKSLDFSNKIVFVSLITFLVIIIILTFLRFATKRKVR